MPIEQSIKQKIEAVGTPLRDWDIRINRGILTGYNEAFIIGKKKRDELIKKDPKSAEIIRPILRGKDIKRYSYDFADKYLITTYNEYTDNNGLVHPSINIKDYPAIKEHLDYYWPQINKRQDRGDTPYNLRRCAYMDDFSKQKIVYREISNNTDACIVEPNIVTNNKCYIITGKHLIYLLIILNSTVFNKMILPQANSTGGKGPDFMKNISIPIPTEDIEVLLESLYNKRISCSNGDIEEFDKNINNIVYSIFELSSAEIEYIETVN